MLRLVMFFVVIVLLAIGTGWLADRPGTVALNWQGYAVELSLMTAVLALALLIAVGIFVHSVYRFVVKSPGMFGGYLKGRRRDRGYAALSRGMLAVGSGDLATAMKAAGEAAKLLPGEPMTQLLNAQTAQAAGDRDVAVETFNTMLEGGETRLLGLRGLYLEARQAKNGEAARHYASVALAEAPGSAWAGKALFEFQCTEHDWDGALKTLQIHTDHRMVDKALARRRRAVLLTAKAMALESGEPEQALALALEAHGLDLGLIPAATIAGRLSTRLGNARRASSVLEQTWRKAPHPEIAETYARVRPGDSVRDRYRRVKLLTQKAAHHPESRIALARAAIAAKDWAVARETLATLTKTDPTVRICELMAAVERGENGDEGRAREWLARSVSALPDPVWTADGVTSEIWLPVSPVTGRLDAFEWKVPVSSVEPHEKEAIEVLSAPVKVTEAPPSATASPAALASTAAENDPVDIIVETTPDDGPATDPDEATPGSGGARPGSSSTMSGRSASVPSAGETVARVAPPAPPDDPGTTDSQKDKKRFGLF